MADILADEGYVRDQSTAETSPRRTQRVLVGIIVVLSLVLIGELVYHLVLAPRISIESIQVESNLGLTEDEIIQIAGVSVGTPYFAVDSEGARERLEALPAVHSASVDVLFPNRIAISVSRRQPLALSIADSADGPLPLVFDAEGIVFAAGDDVRGLELPVISGLRFLDAEPGIRLPELVQEFLAQVHSVRMTDPSLLSLFSEFRIVPRNDYVYEVVLYPMHYPVEVRIGTSFEAEMIEYIMMMLDVLRSEGRLESVSEIDFRGGEGVLRYREGFDG